MPEERYAHPLFEAVAEIRSVKSRQKAILICLAVEAIRDEPGPTLATLAGWVNLSTPTTLKHLRGLISAGYVVDKNHRYELNVDRVMRARS
jgi:DNA-binding IclR family transcriptional regulator